MRPVSVGHGPADCGCLGGRVVDDLLQFGIILAETFGDELPLRLLGGFGSCGGDDLAYFCPADAVLSRDRLMALAEPDGCGDPSVSFGVRCWHTPPEG
jgi:hypothetical protein